MFTCVMCILCSVHTQAEVFDFVLRSVQDYVHFPQWHGCDAVEVVQLEGVLSYLTV